MSKTKKITSLLLAVIMVVGVLFGTMITANAATSSAKTCLFTFYADSAGKQKFTQVKGTLVSGSSSTTYKVTLPKAPAAPKKGQTFAGWATKKSATSGTAAGKIVYVKKGTAFYATFKTTRYTVTVKFVDEAGKTLKTTGVSVAYGGKFNIPVDTVLSVPNRALVGWKTSDGKIYRLDENKRPAALTITGNKTITLKAYCLKTYGVTYIGWKGTGSSAKKTNKYVQGTSITLPTNPIAYEHFVSWNDGKKNYSAGSKYQINKAVTFHSVLSTKNGIKTGGKVIDEEASTCTKGGLLENNANNRLLCFKTAKAVTSSKYNKGYKGDIEIDLNGKTEYADKSGTIRTAKKVNVTNIALVSKASAKNIVSSVKVISTSGNRATFCLVGGSKKGTLKLPMKVSYKFDDGAGHPSKVYYRTVYFYVKNA